MAKPQASAGRVLVLDDNRDAADTTGVLLEAHGFAVRVAYDSHQALSLLEGFEAQVAALDIGLPGMDGYALVRAIRARPHGHDCGFLALTGYGQREDIQRAQDAGFDMHQTKPIDPDALLAIVARPAAEARATMVGAASS